MEGFIVNKQGSSGIGINTPDSYLSLLAKHRDLEVMLQTLRSDATVWVAPAEDDEAIEFFYILSGCLIAHQKKEQIELREGDSFYTNNLSGNIALNVVAETKLLYITNRPVFDYLFEYQGDLNDLLRKIDEKDNYTYHHCGNVMQYSLLLVRKLGLAETSMYDIVTASLFHDVGKCYIPEAILCKTGALTKEEFEKMKQHPVYGAKILEKKFSKRIADIVRSHHERLDGTGYPAGLCGDEISQEGRIIAIADCFDAMTSKRCYNEPKTYLDAVQELCDMPEKYEHEVCLLLKELVLEGAIPLQNNTAR